MKNTKGSTLFIAYEVLKCKSKWPSNAMKFGANLDNEGSVTFLPSLASPNLLSTLPPKLPYYLHLFITSTPLFYKRNKKSHLIILLSQSSCHAPSNSLGLGPLLGLGFMGLSILYLVSIKRKIKFWECASISKFCIWKIKYWFLSTKQEQWKLKIVFNLCRKIIS